MDIDPAVKQCADGLHGGAPQCGFSCPSGNSPCAALHDICCQMISQYTVGCADPGAPHQTNWQVYNRRGEHCSPQTRLIGRCVGAQCAPLRNRLCRPDANGAPRSYPREPSLAALPQFALPHPTVKYFSADKIRRCRP